MCQTALDKMKADSCTSVMCNTGINEKNEDKYVSFYVMQLLKK